MRAGRNDPCPCGSGKKLKKCHLVEQTAARDGARRAAATHDLDNRMKERVLAYAKSELSMSPEDLEDHYPVALEPEDLQMFIPLVTYEAKIKDGRSLASLFLSARGSTLAPHDRAWLESQLRAHLSAWEILAVERGRGLSARDCFTGETRFVYEVSASQTLTEGDTVLARVVDHDGVSTFCGMYPQALSARILPDFVAEVRTDIFARAMHPAGTTSVTGIDAISLDELREPGIAETLLEAWQDSLDDAIDAARGTRPELQTTDGDPLVFANDIFEVHPRDHAEIKRRLLAAALELASIAGDAANRPPVVWVPGKEKGEIQLVFVRPSDATVIGHASLDATTLTLETLSTKRADALRELVEGACGELIKHDKRIEDTAAEVFGNGEDDFDT